jgi:hypothetical protein
MVKVIRYYGGQSVGCSNSKHGFGLRLDPREACSTNGFGYEISSLASDHAQILWLTRLTDLSDHPGSALQISFLHTSLVPIVPTLASMSLDDPFVVN